MRSFSSTLLIICSTGVLLASCAETIVAQTTSQTTVYSRTQLPRTWTSRDGNFSFDGVAVRKEGNYVSFKTSDNTEISLPFKYLGEEAVAALTELSSGSAGRPSVSPPVPGPIPEASSAENPGDSPTVNGGPQNGLMSSGRSTSRPPMGIGNPAAPSNSDAGSSATPPRNFLPGMQVDVRSGGQWKPGGRVIAMNPRIGKYLVKYTENGIPKTSWLDADELRSSDSDNSPSAAPRTRSGPTPGPPSPAPNPSASLKYKAGDKVQIEWKGSWFSGEILEAKEGQYLIHYDNYSKTWDEWVTPDRVKDR